MKRRDFFKTLAAAVAVVVSGPSVLAQPKVVGRGPPTADAVTKEYVDKMTSDALVRDISEHEDRLFFSSCRL